MMKLKPFICGNYLGSFPCANDVCQDIFSDVSQKEVEEYARALLAEHIVPKTKKQSNGLLSFLCCTA